MIQMIYGAISLDDNVQISKDLLNKISVELSWSNFVSGELSQKNFFGKYLFNNRLPYHKEDFIYHDKENDIIVLTDGFIYNKNEIIKNLSLDENIIYTSHLICKAFLKSGQSFANDLNGDFAICIYLAKKKQIFFYRDHLGIRPLGVCRTGSVIFFSTDVMGLCKGLFNNEKIDQKYLVNLFMEMGFDYELLPNSKVERVMPGHCLNLNTVKRSNYRYWSPEEIQENRKLDYGTVIHELEFLLKDSVKIRADKRFNAASHISGGLDSGTVTALARNEYHDQLKFHGFSWTPDFKVNPNEISSDERSLVRSICQQHNITPIHIKLDVSAYLNSVSNWRYSFELIFEEQVAKSAQSNNVNLIFSGWGGDEFISCNNLGIDRDLIMKFNWPIFLNKYPLNRPKRLVYALVYNVILASAKWSFLRLKTDPIVYRYIKKAAKNNRIPGNRRISYNSRHLLHLQSIESRYLGARCEDFYFLGQQHGIEYRYPLLDKRIVEYMLKVPSACLVDGQNNRMIIRSIGKNILPENVITNQSKDDPARSFFLEQITKDVTNELINERNEFRGNKDLNFVDFNLLEKAIESNTKTSSEDDFSSILFYIKRAHEFTKGYYS